MTPRTPLSLWLPFHAVADALAVGFFCTALIPTWAAQLTCQVFFTLVANVFFLIAPSMIQRYAPPELFGTVLGLVFAMYGVVQIAFSALQNAILRVVVHHTHGDPSAERWRVVDALWFWMAVVIGVAAANYVAWAKVAPPTMGVVTMADVREAKAFRH